MTDCIWTWLVLSHVHVHDKKADVKICQVREKGRPELQVDMQDGKLRWCKSCVIKYMHRFDLNSLFNIWWCHHHSNPWIKDTAQWHNQLETVYSGLYRLADLKYSHAGRYLRSKAHIKVTGPTHIAVPEWSHHLWRQTEAAYVYVTKASSMWWRWLWLQAANV